MKLKLSLICVLLFSTFAALGSDEAVHWSYDGPEGPEHWGELAKDFDLCFRGKNQSPIDLQAHLDADLPELMFDYTQSQILTEVNTGHAIQEGVMPGNFVAILGDRYELRQFHFHSPSEHTVAGKHYPMEMHLVHESPEGELLVVGLMFEEGEHNKMMEQLPSFRLQRGEDPNMGEFNYNALIMGREHYFLYNGSLTTPPCTEGVKWVVIKQPIIASPEQIQHYHDLLGFDNNRPPQPKNARIIIE